MFVTPAMASPAAAILSQAVSSSSLQSSGTIKCEPFWEDREVRFDCSSKELQLRKGEDIIQVFKDVEDTKGNSGEVGTLTITALRIIWKSDVKSRINLSIGLSTVTQITCKQLHSKLRGRYSALDLMTKSNGTRYEFIYTHFVAMDPSTAASKDTLSKVPSDCQVLIKTISSVCKAYSSTKLFRDLKLRSAIINSTHELKALPGEQIYSKFNGVWNLSSDQGNLGTFILTSVRIVWYANSNEQFNLSLPLIQIQNVRVRESKFGRALVIESSESSGGYILGFRLDPISRLEDLYQELSTLYQIHASKPNLGVYAALSTLDPRILGSSSELAAQAAQAKLEKPTVSALDFVDEEDDKSRTTDVIASYLALDDDTSVKKDNKVVFCPTIGLAIEEIKPGFTLESLWKVLPD